MITTEINESCHKTSKVSCPEREEKNLYKNPQNNKEYNNFNKGINKNKQATIKYLHVNLKHITTVTKIVTKQRKRLER